MHLGKLTGAILLAGALALGSTPALAETPSPGYVTKEDKVAEYKRRLAEFQKQGDRPSPTDSDYAAWKKEKDWLDANRHLLTKEDKVAEYKRRLAEFQKQGDRPSPTDSDYAAWKKEKDWLDANRHLLRNRPTPPNTGVNDAWLRADLSDLPGDSGEPYGTSLVPMTAAASEALRLRIGEPTFRSRYPASAYLPRNHQPQKRSWWCSAATASMALGHMGVTVSQETLAREFNILKGGPGPGRAFVQTVLNNHGRGKFAWQNVTLPWSPTAAQKATYKRHLLASITGATGSGKKYPLIGNVFLVKGSPLPSGYPTPKTNIRHYFEIRGYKENGGWSQIQDPGSSVWKSVEAHYPVKSDKLVTMMGERGYLH